jgi:outer membrane protein TolC
MTNTFNSMTRVRTLCLSIFLVMGFSPTMAAEPKPSASHVLDLNSAVNAALINDPWLMGNKHSQEAIQSMSVAAGTLPDPKISIGLANVAADTLDLNQEAMTQFKIGVSQVFPRGNSLAIKKEQLEMLSAQYPYQRQDREASVVVTISKLWLDAYRAQESIALIEKDRALFEQLADVANASYSTAVGRTQQQDIIRAELELTRLEDRLSILKQHQDTTKQQLAEWFNDSFLAKAPEKDSKIGFVLPSKLTLSRELPSITLLQPALSTDTSEVNPQLLFEFLSVHPAIGALDQKIKASNTGIELAKQKYKPEWGVNAGYGFRDADAFGNDRADLFSVGISFDVPIFTANRQDKQVQSAVSQASAVKTEKWLLLRKLMASFESERARLLRLNERKILYQSKLLPQMHDQAEASLSAYTNDTGDFAEVVRARIAELNATIDALDINVERQKSIIQLNYFFMVSANDMINRGSRLGEVQ